MKHYFLLLGLILFLGSTSNGQPLTITSPTAESVWVGGSTHTITWTGGTSANVKIKFLWRDLGELTIVESTPNDGSYTWTVQDGYTGRVGIRLYGDGEYPIKWFTRENSAGGIYIHSPDYGYVWKQGTNHAIVWTDNISENVKIDLYYQRHELIPVPTEWVSTIASSTPSDGAYGWDIPSDLSTNEYEVCIQSVSAPSTRVCTRHFTIGNPPQTCADEYEPNDEIVNPSINAFSSEIGRQYFHSESISGNLHESGDWDHYRVNIEVTGTLNINLTDVPDEFDLQLYDNYNNYKAGSFTDGDEHVNVHITSPDFYYIIVGSMTGAFDCSLYTLSLDWAADLFLNVTPASRNVGSEAGTTSFDVSSNANWSASEGASWLSTEKTSSGLLTISYDENTSTESRTADINVSADGVSTRTVTVSQEGASCNLTVTPGSRSVGPAAGTTSFTVSSNVSWSVNESADWLSTSVNGNTVNVNFQENTMTSNRSANLTISGGLCSEIVTVTQDGAACSLTVAPGSRSVGPAAGTTSFTVSSNVPWSVNESADWLSTSVDGSTVNINYQENTSSTNRTANLTMEGGGCSEIVSVTQDGAACSLAVTPESRSVGSAAGTTSFTVTSNVAWSVNESADWLTTSVNGNTVNINYQENTSNNNRTANLTISGGGCSEIVSVTQNGAACSLTVTPESRSVGPASGTTSFTVSSNVSWGLNESADWLTAVVNGSTVNINYQENTTSTTRTASLTITGGACSQVVTVVQDAAGCSLTVTPESWSVGSPAGTTTFTVNSNASWSVNESADWLSTTVAGNTINVSFDANETTSSRSADIIVSGGGCSRTVTLTQSGVQPLFQIGTSAITLRASAGSTATFSITSNVDWTIEKNEPWLDVNPVTGSGSAQVTVSANETNNTGIVRSDTVRAACVGISYLIVVSQDYATSVSDQMESGLNIYPNPSESEIHVKLGVQLTKFTVRISDIRGSLIFLESFKDTPEFSIDLSGYNSGMYQIEILYKDGITVRKFIKQ